MRATKLYRAYRTRRQAYGFWYLSLREWLRLEWHKTSRELVL